jgi:pyruvate,water dikinase
MTNDRATRLSGAGLISLDHPDCEDRAVAGNKAATLAVLRRAGFEVPPGVVVSARALSGVNDQLPAAVRAALREVPELIGRGPWAVRSSGTAEDREEASFAGQYETVLNVEGEGLFGAVLRCWRSRLTYRVKVYGAERGHNSMAVLIQPMIAADAAGVAFTADPVSGLQRTVIEAVEGLGERLVSGAATPERWTVEEDGSIESPPTAKVLETEQARAIGDLARRVEEHLGHPQDIEWAIDGSSLWLLQARPITTLSNAAEPITIPIVVPPGYWERDNFHETVPTSPFGRILAFEQIVKVFPVASAEFGILVDRVEATLIGGWLYARVVPVGAPPPRRSGREGAPIPPPRWLLAILMRLHPAIRRRIRAARQALAVDLPASVIRRWFDEWQPQHRQDAEEALAVDLGSISDQKLAAHLDHRIEVAGHPAHLMVGYAHWILLFELAEACRELLGWDTARMLTLLEGLSTTTTQPARDLAHLAELARSKPGITELLTKTDETTPGRLVEVDPEFNRAFSDYVQANGHRSLNYDIIEPTLAEMPHLLLRLVADQLRRDFSPDREAAEALARRSQAAEEARRLLASHPETDRKRFERTLARARQAYPALEDRVWWTYSMQAALLRYLAREIGRRLSDRGQLAAVEDVFFLEAEDARSALFDGNDRQETARVARGWREWAMAHPGPLSYGEAPGEPPPFDLLPLPARLVNQGVMWGLTPFLETRRGANGEKVLAGTPASPGRYTGTVRVVMGEHQFEKIGAGDVVVCAATSPAWSVVFPSVGALVTDAGGILTHPAIIAREHGVPAVVGTANATELLRDGQIVTVDGNTGLVHLGGAGDRSDLGTHRRGVDL